MSYAELSCVRNFSVGHAEFGRVTWEGATDVNGLDLDSTVVFKQGEVEVYPMAQTDSHTDAETTGKDSKDSRDSKFDECASCMLARPERGSGLNKAARITLIGCWPFDSTEDVDKTSNLNNGSGSASTRKDLRLEKYERRLRRLPATTFFNYDANYGIWEFGVEGF